MYETLERLYQTGQLSLAGLERAVEKEWITEEQKQEIINND